jgi:hypothetical protein
MTETITLYAQIGSEEKFCPKTKKYNKIILSVTSDIN